jgi:hypothetical protein
MGGTRIKKYNHGLMVDREITRHYWCPLGEFGESGEVHSSLADLDLLLLALALAGWVGCLPLEGSSRLRAILDEVGWTSAVETMIVVVSLVGWWKTRSRTLLLLLLRLGCWWSIKSSLLGWSSYPSARQVASRRCSSSGVLDQPIPRWLRR